LIILFAISIFLRHENKKSNTMKVKRFGVSLEEDLLESLDELVKEQKFPNRSQAIRFLIKKNLFAFINIPLNSR